MNYALPPVSLSPPLSLLTFLAVAIEIPHLIGIEMCIAATSHGGVEGVCQHLTRSIEFIAISMIATRRRKQKEKQLSEVFHNQFNGSEITRHVRCIYPIYAFACDQVYLGGNCGGGGVNKAKHAASINSLI